MSIPDDWPGGMRPTYNAVDHDARLTREARTAAATIAALQRYHAEHNAFPADQAALAVFFPPTPNEMPSWRYNRSSDGSGYTLSLRLGWDPDLVYEFDGTQPHWIFSPGDGSPSKTIRLNP
jgi:hypothetical protein